MNREFSLARWPAPRMFLWLVCLLAVPVPDSEAQTLKIATVAPEGSTWMKDMRAGAAEVKERTEGRVLFKFYGGGVQGSDRQVLRKMRTGQLHGGAFTSGGLNQFHMDADIFSLPLMFDGPEEARLVRDELEPKVRQRLEDSGFVNFGFAAAGFAYLMSNTPMASLDDLKGRKIWTPEGDPIGYAALQALGIAPVIMPITDVMTGLQTDLLDSITAPPVAAVVFQWHTRLSYITDFPVAYVYAALMIQKKFFERLSADDQLIVREVMEGVYRNFDSSGEVDNRSALEALQSGGLETISPNSAETDSWREIVNASHRNLAEQGVFDQELLEEMLAILSAHRGH